MLGKKATQQQSNTTERQSNTTQLIQGGYFSKKKLPQAAQLAGPKSHIQCKATKAPQSKHHKLDKQVNSNLV